MKKRWTYEKAHQHVAAVQAKRRPYGLAYCSACDFLHIAPRYRDAFKEG